MSQNFERFGVEAVWLDAKFEKGVSDYNASMKKADKETQKFSKDSTRSFKQFDQQASASFLDAAAKVAVWARAAQVAFAQYEQAAQETAQRASLQALAASYGTDAGKIVTALQEVSDQTLTTSEAVSVANSALLAGGASFASEIPRLFEIARAAATATGQDVTFVLDTLVRGIAKGSPLLIDNAEIYLSLGDAVEEYAQGLGKTADELTRQERTQATLNAVLTQGQSIVEGVGSSALEATTGVNQLTTAAKQVGEVARAAFVAIGETGDGITLFGRNFTGVADLITQGLNSLIQLIPIAAGGFATLFDLITNFGVDDLGALISGQTTLGEIFDDAADRGIQAFTRTSEALGIFTQDTAEAVPVVEELGDATEETAGDIDKMQQSLANARVNAMEAFLQRAIQAERQLEDAAIQRARKIEDMERQSAQRRAQIEEQYAQTIADIEAQAAEQRRSRQIDLARQLEQIERNYQERKRAIQAQFAVSFQNAVRSRDALALVEAIRTRKKDLDEAKRQRDQDRSEAQTNYAQQEQEQQRSLQRQIEAAKRARAQQIADAQEAQRQELEDLARTDQRKLEDQQRADQRFLQDQQRAFRDQQVQAMAAYRQNESIYTQHLQRMLQLTNTYIPRIFTGMGTGRPQLGSIGGSGVQQMAEGGALIANSATNVTFGEAGPELAIFQPLSQMGPVNAPSPQVTGQMRHEIAGDIQASMAGFQGRLTAAVNEAVLTAFRQVLR